MKFFVPLAADEAQAESVYEGFRKFISAPPQTRRIWKLKWTHAGKPMEGEIGKPLSSYYQTGAEPVLAIFDTGACYMICTPSRGGVRGDPVLAGYNEQPMVTYFCSGERT
jgi:hypothetical protein